MPDPFARPVLDVATNHESPLHPPRLRLRFGHGFVTYPQAYAAGGEAPFWVVIPTADPVALTVEVPAQTWAKSIRIIRQGKVVAEAQGNVRRVVHEVAAGGHGRYEVRVSPPLCPVRAKLRHEWVAMDGGKPLIPWNFWFYPFGKVDPKDGFDSNAVQRSAMTKLDGFLDPTGRSNAVMEWEEAHHLLDRPGDWQGHCTGGASASIYFEAPVATHEFTTDELQLIASEWAGRRHQPGEAFDVGSTTSQYLLHAVQKSRKYGHLMYLLRPDDFVTHGDHGSQLAAIAISRFASLFADELAQYDLAIPARARGHLEPASARADLVRMFAEEGLRFLRFLAHHLGQRHEAMVIDLGGLGSGDAAKGVGEVWNHAVFHCTIDFLEREDAARPSPEDPNEEEDQPTRNLLDDHPLGMDLEVRVAFNKDAPPPARGPTPAVVKPYGVELEGGAYDALSFALRVEYDGRGIPRNPDPEHFVEAWAARAPGRWIPRSLITLARPVSTLTAAQTAKEEHQREYNLEVRGDLTRLLRLRGKYR